MLLALLMLAAPAAEPLPEHLDIPAEHSTVICPDQLSAQNMIDQYYRVRPAPNNHTIDVEHFFEGLRATGCSQDGARKGAITISEAKSRAIVDLANGTERMLRYEGKDEAGTRIAGIVSEDGNNSFPRTDLARWLSARSEDGWLDARSSEAPSIFYRCPTAEAAKTVIDGMAGMEKAKETAFSQKLQKAAAQSGCRTANDRYMITGLLGSAGNECGFECYIDLTALSAVDRSGQTVGLIYDAALM
ncbi:MAG: hypothetical protein IPM67_09385 [Sphingomonadales bacterium]|jgi:hypothetical protein|nr:hypothetical protein [Sphingomonadales bacterium]MBK9268836.1 hypothetical protein [Sphingomonadales bacterium]MBP6434948.1 hypothetical protein [Sphingorhabdus sp.]